MPSAVGAVDTDLKIDLHSTMITWTKQQPRRFLAPADNTSCDLDLQILYVRRFEACATQVWDITDWAVATGALPHFNIYANSHT